MKLSPSSMQLFVDCPKKYFYRYIREPKITQPIEWPMIQGTKVHSFVAYLHRPIKAGSEPRPYYFNNIDSARGAWFTQWNIAVDKDKHKIVEYSKENRKIFGTTGWKCILQYWKTMEAIMSPLEVESRYTYPLNGLAEVRGVVDQIRESDLLTLNKSGIHLDLMDYPPALYNPVIILDIKTGYLSERRKVLFDGDYEKLKEVAKEIENLFPNNPKKYAKKVGFYLSVIEFIVRRELPSIYIETSEALSEDEEISAERISVSLRSHINDLVENSRWESDEEYLQRLKMQYDFKFDIQINTYYHLYKQKHGKLPLAFAWLHLPENIFVITTRDNEDLQRIEEQIIYISEAIQAGVFPKQLDSYGCKNRCGYYNFCLADRDFLTSVTRAIPATPEYIVKKAKKTEKKYKQKRLRGTSVPRVKRDT
ncbi:MAG: PD-(D/E)XK nuclease family protein [Patescibacteria group bacterium]